MDQSLPLFPSPDGHPRIPEAAKSNAHRWCDRIHEEIQTMRDRLATTSAPTRVRARPRPIAGELRTAADDLRRGVDPGMIARRLDVLAADIDPTLTGRVA